MPNVPVIIAAAGMGRRLGLDMPKCLVPVNGRPILDYQLELLRATREVRLVVGFHADEVAARARALRPDIVLFHNHDYAHTATLQSLALAARDLEHDCLCLDGDMIVEETSFHAFLRGREAGSACMAISDEIGDDPVYTATTRNDASLQVTGFSRTEPSPHEWANAVFMPARWLQEEKNWGGKPVFALLQHHLPLEAVLLRRLEVDTPEDLRRAENEVRHNPVWKSQ